MSIMDVLKGFVTLPKAAPEPPLTQASEAKAAPKEQKKRGRKPKSQMTFTVSRGDFVVKMD